MSLRGRNGSSVESAIRWMSGWSWVGDDGLVGSIVDGDGASVARVRCGRTAHRGRRKGSDPVEFAAHLLEARVADRRIDKLFHR